MANVLRIDPQDNVVVALSDLAQGTRLELAASAPDLNVVSVDAVPFGHKIAIVAIQQGQPVIKYGASIGLASQDVTPGQHVHVHNLYSVRGAAIK